MRPGEGSLQICCYLKEVAVLLGIPASRVYELASRRELKVVRIGRSLRFRRRDIEAYIDSQELQGEPAPGVPSLPPPVGALESR